MRAVDEELSMLRAERDLFGPPFEASEQVIGR